MQGGGPRGGPHGHRGMPGVAPGDAVTCERPRDVILLPLPGLVVLIGRALVVAGEAALAGRGLPRAVPGRVPLLGGGVVELGTPARPHPPGLALPRAPCGETGRWEVPGTPGGCGGGTHHPWECQPPLEGVTHL